MTTASLGHTPVPLLHLKADFATKFIIGHLSF